ncbi:glucans biosynthesis glucosyltransferase MdoH [Achromobacter sp. GG226]|uniref:glucans biosynthesis glucosyltransferase MdoH n=1 Tax=Verticiella alkaliphila TaxID=2779529 RepID=UPI001C0C10E9|nr:glucans biosynthesis glucosyltransferase MdoH [Verticiella sp. GG226]MBU4609093.1 glucans biosynthesis glucosyltransferase MdoH [Verticiella sp. GG226]
MNNVNPTGSDALPAYLSRLPASEAEREALAQAWVSRGADAGGAWTAALAPRADGRGAGASQRERLTSAFGQELQEQGVLREDADTGACMLAAPELARASMVPEPWTTNPLVRAWSRARGKAERRRSEPRQSDDARGWRAAGHFRRSVLLVLVFAQTAVATWYMRGVLPYQGGQWLEIAILLLFALLFCWVSSGFWTALMGFVQLMKGRDRYSISASTVGDEPIAPEARTAIVMPICNEDVARVFAGLRATFESVARHGNLDRFDFFILSDSYHADNCVAEQRAWVDLCREVGGFGKIFYRRRRRRVKRKSGNIDDFCRRWGNDYRYMVVLDADSVMSGECLTRLVQLMEAHPDAGIIQTAPRAAGMDSLYARIQQFATRVYGPLFTAGLHYWQLGESHYWGHNAIIRLKPFIEHCALAPLPGKGSFAGAILSHDFVEAALMRRAGWGVWIAYDLPGSYEELPPNLLDELKRDQRWCHGNLMNFRLFLIEGVHPVHRAVFLTGVMSYLSAPLWFLFLVLSTALLAVHTLMEPTYFVEPRQLFPIWPQWHPGKAIALFTTTAILLFLPKILSVVLVWAKGAKLYGGSAKLFGSMLLEVLFSMLLAPVRMLFHTKFIAAAFLGWKVQWNSPARGNDETGWPEAIRTHGFQTLLGIVWGAGVAWLNPNFLWWMAPILLALFLIIPVSVFSSRVSLGQGAFRSRLFRIPEETEPPRELRATSRYVRFNHSQPQPGFHDAIVDPVSNALACAMATARHRPVPLIETAREHAVRQALDGGPDSLSQAARIKLLDDPVVLARLHRDVWSDPARRASWAPSDATS